MHCRVVKVGGSLFSSANVGTSVANWIRLQQPKRTIIVTGGGVWADQIRQLDARSPLPASSAHWLAIRAMSLTALLLSNLLTESDWIQEYAELQDWHSGETSETAVYDVAEFLRDIEPLAAGIQLPHGWDVTSDSIAARLAQVVGADELVLLKSIDSSTDCLDTAAKSGVVDAFFPKIATALLASAIEIRIDKPEVV